MLLDPFSLQALVNNFIWPFIRIAAFLMTAPLIGSQMVPMRVRLILTLALTVLLMPLIPLGQPLQGLNLLAMLLVAQQILVGVALGFFLQLSFHVFVLSGQMIAMQMGLGFASMIDPSNGVNVAIVSSIYLMIASLLFITLDGHLLMIDVLIQSFYLIPADQLLDLAETGLLGLVDLISWVFSSALVIALPALTALLLTNLGFGVMTRAAPQMNIFALGFPVALLFGLGLLWFTMERMIVGAESHFSETFSLMNAWLN